MYICTANINPNTEIHEKTQISLKTDKKHLMLAFKCSNQMFSHFSPHVVGGFFCNPLPLDLCQRNYSESSSILFTISLCLLHKIRLHTNLIIWACLMLCTSSSKIGSSQEWEEAIRIDRGYLNIFSYFWDYINKKQLKDSIVFYILMFVFVIVVHVSCPLQCMLLLFVVVHLMLQSVTLIKVSCIGSYSITQNILTSFFKAFML